MDIHLLALQLMALQGLLGAFDTIYHHELTESLPSRLTATKELWIHSIRASLYSIIFIGLSYWQWHGVWAIVLFTLFGIEIVLTLWDFVTEDKTRLLPATERITHTVLAINGGAFIALLMVAAYEWVASPSALYFVNQGYLSWFLVLCGIGVGLSGLRDGFAAYRLSKQTILFNYQEPIQFSAESKTVLITGATGFVGKLLVKALITDEHTVLVLSRNAKQAAWNFSGKVICIESMRQLPASFKIDVIINLAGARILGWRWTKARKNELLKSMVQITQSIVDWISTAQTKPSLLLSASAIGYYGIQAPTDLSSLTEKSPSQNIFMSQLCQDWEKTALLAEQYGTKVVCMRLGLVLGHEGALPQLLLPIQFFLGGALAGGQQCISWIHIDDVLRGIAHLMSLSFDSSTSVFLQSELNFTAPKPVTQLELSVAAANILNRPNWLATPGWPMRFLLGEQADLLLKGQRVIPSRLLESGFQFKYSTIEKALQNLLRF